MSSSQDPVSQGDPLDSIDLPELQEGELDAEKLALYLSDLSTQTEGLTLNVKDAPRGSFEGVEDLARLKTLLIDKKVWGAQLKYRVDGVAWLDTLMVKETGIRLIRIRQQ